MPTNLIAPEEIRDALALDGQPRSAAWLAADLAVSTSTVRRHLATLIERDQVSTLPHTRPALYAVTAEGRRASAENEGL